MKTAVFSSLGALVLLGLGGFWFFQPAKVTTPKRAPALERAEPTPTPAMPLFERRSVPQAAEAVATAPSAEPVAEPESEPQSEAETSLEQERVEYENRFDAERGRSGLRRLETVVTNAATRIAVRGSQIDKIECRDSICKMDVKFDSPDVDSEFFHKLSRPDDRSEDAQYLGSFDIVIPERTTAADGKILAQAYLKQPSFKE